MQTLTICRRLVYLLILLASLGSCRKDKACQINFDCYANTTCENFPEMLISWFQESRYQFKTPHFNPLNSAEFVYYFKDNELGLHQLIKYNLLSNEKTVLVNDIRIYGQPKWGKKGWIAFTSQSAYVEHIYIIKDNGDSLTQVTTSLANYAPFWNVSGDELLWTHSPDLGSQKYLLRMNRSSFVVDSVSQLGAFYYVDVYNDKALQIISADPNSPSGGQGYYGYHNLNAPPFTSNNFNTIGVSATSSMEGICWHTSGQKFFVSHGGANVSGVYSVTLDGIASRFLINCDTKRHTTISCSQDGKKLIAERIDSSLELDQNNNPTGKIIQKSTIWLIDLETALETKIDLE